MTRLTSPIFNIMEETSDVSVKNKYYVYILLSLRDKKLYIGFTMDLKSRLIRHASGKVIATRNRRPFKLIRYEYFVNMADAKAREVFLKSGGGHSQLKAILKRTLKDFGYKYI